MNDKYDIDFGRYLEYREDSPSGLVWKERSSKEFKLWRSYLSWNRRFSGTTAGSISINPHGYKSWRIRLNGITYICSRIIYLIMIGPIPDGYEVDHEDVNSLNNKIENLRLATTSQNNLNKNHYASNDLKSKGVWRVGNKFRSAISINGVKRNLGNFDTLELAEQAYTNASISYHGEYSPLK